MYWMIVRQVLITGVTAIAAAWVVAASAAQGLSTFLFGVAPLDVSMTVGVGASMLAVALGASALPVRRAVRVDPMVTLRSE
jgi:ABC-type lipoprotein release transport system permease subunit